MATSSERPTYVTLKGFPVMLALHRTPQFLRFTYKGNTGCARNWDALDQLDDEPMPYEFIIAAELVHVGTLHIDRVVKRRKVGEWHRAAHYEQIEDQPAEDVLRDREKWQAWCLARAGKLIQS